MATRLKTVIYSFEQLTSTQADNSATAFADLTVNIPDAIGSKPFLHVWIELYAMDQSTATGATVASKTIECQIDAVAYTGSANAVSITHSGENTSWLFQSEDFASYFNTNFTGTSHTVRCRGTIDISTGTGLTTNNWSALLYVTYQYDDTSTTQIKTVFIPLESATGAAPTGAGATEIGTNQVPNLDSELPEASKTYRDIFFLAEGNESSTSTAAFTLAFSLDAEANADDGSHTANLNSSRWYRRIWKRTDMATNAAHAFKWRASKASHNHMSIILIVTYEFNATTTTSVWNSVLFPLEMASPMGSGSKDVQRFHRNFSIPEPGKITLKQSGIQLYFDTANDIAGLAVKIGGASARSYTQKAGSATAGGYALSHRFDAGSAGGAGTTLARGRNNEIIVDVYRTDTTDLGWNVSGLIMLNYTSDKSAQSGGVANHTHTVFYPLLSDDVAAARLRTSASMAPAIPETNYWLSAVGFRVNAMSSGTNAIGGYQLQAEVLSGEGEGDGYRSLYADTVHTDPENGVRVFYCRARDDFKRHPGDMDDYRLDIEDARTYRLATGVGLFIPNALMFITYHSITFTIAGTVSGYSGDGSGITVEIFQSSNGEKVGETTTNAGGGFTFVWYDNVEDMFCTAAEDATHVGRSSDDTAT